MKLIRCKRRVTEIHKKAGILVGYKIRIQDIHKHFGKDGLIIFLLWVCDICWWCGKFSNPIEAKFSYGKTVRLQKNNSRDTEIKYSQDSVRKKIKQYKVRLFR